MTNGMATALGRLARDLPRLQAHEAELMIGRLRVAAVAEGLSPVAEIADGLAAALRRDRAATPIGVWIDALRHAATCPARAGAEPLLLATIGVRLAH